MAQQRPALRPDVPGHRQAFRGEVWHVVSDEFVTGGHAGESVVQTRWEDGPALWAASRFGTWAW